MIPIEQQVISLPLAQRLAALGVEQSSYFVWDTMYIFGRLFVRSTRADEAPDDRAKRFAAFTVPELAALLGDNLSMIERLLDGRFNAAYSYATGCIAPTMPEALGLLLEAVLNRD
jgi:hypothetical protein